LGSMPVWWCMTIEQHAYFVVHDHWAACLFDGVGSSRYACCACGCDVGVDMGMAALLCGR